MQPVKPMQPLQPSQKVSELNCPICNGRHVTTHFSAAKDPMTGESFQIAECGDCKVNMTFPMPADLNSYYPTEYRQYSGVTAALLKSFYRMRVRKWAGLTAKPGRALEIGCGAGLMLEALKSFGWNVMGLERTESVAAQARETLGLNVVSKDITDLPAVPSFDLIILFNVLEHLRDPAAILRECAARLNPGGRVIINVPNFASWQAHFSKEKWLHLDPPRHLFHFSPDSLNSLIQRVGLTSVKIDYASLEHDPYGWVQSALNKTLSEDNVLTKYLMGMKKFDLQVFLSFVLGAAFGLPALLLSFVSWWRKSGALMQVVATKA